MKYTHLLLALGIGIVPHLIQPNLSWAGGFTQPEGAAFVSTTFRTLESRTFEKLELEAYAEYGLKDNLTLIFKVPYQWISDDQFNPKRTNRNSFTRKRCVLCRVG
jgi:hypothetical protein